MENKWLGFCDNCCWAHALTPWSVCISHSIKVFEGYANDYEIMLSRVVLSSMASLKEAKQMIELSACVGEKDRIDFVTRDLVGHS
jgi:hypothetical protein